MTKREDMDYIHLKITSALINSKETKRYEGAWCIGGDKEEYMAFIILLQC